MLSVKVPDRNSPLSQGKLVSSEVGHRRRALGAHLGSWFEEHPHEARCHRQVVERRAREGCAQGARAHRRKGRSTWRAAGQACECRNANPSRAEMFIVEAIPRGFGKQARNRENQAVLPLRGKILNVERDRSTRCCLCRDRHADYPLGTGSERHRYRGLHIAKLRTTSHIMTDADVDGAIRTLCSPFYRKCRDHRARPSLYRQPPLYKVKRGASEQYLKDAKALENYSSIRAGRGGLILGNGQERAASTCGRSSTRRSTCAPRSMRCTPVTRAR